MADIDVIIKIPEKEYELCRKYNGHLGDHKLISYAIANGTPLPKGHGRLIDGDILEDNLDWFEKVTSEDSIVNEAKHNMLMNCIHIVRTTPTIIEAESEEE